MNRDHDTADQDTVAADLERARSISGNRVRIEVMTTADVAEVARVERRCFSNPWPTSAYRRELQAPHQNHYLILRREAPEPPVALVDATSGRDGAAPDAAGPGKGHLRAMPRRTLLPLPIARRFGATEPPRPDPIVGFAGMWVMYDEAHITTIAVEAACRGQGLGELLVVAMFGEALRRRAEWLTLEVRASNDAAQRLYTKYGMVTKGRRRRYYSDNNEDALILWSRTLHDATYRAEIAELRGRLLHRLGYDPVGLAAWPGETAATSPIPAPDLRSAAS